MADPSGSSDDAAAEQSHSASHEADPRALGLLGIWERIKEHKILQWGLGYFGAAIAIAHGQELMAEAFDWPHLVGRILMSVLVLGLPVVVTLAWYHGHKGLKRVSQGELMIVSTLVVIAAGLLIVFVRAPVRGGEQSGNAAIAGRDAAPGEVARASDFTSSRPEPAASRPTKPRIAILPFENLSPDSANAFFADGIHEEILTVLSTNAVGLEVISRTTMMSFKGKPVRTQDVARELGATHVLEGSVRREGDHVRVTLQLIDGATDNHIWSKDYDRTLHDVLTLQTEIATEVSDQLSVTMLAAAERAKPPTNAMAYDLYLKAGLAYQGLGTYSPRADFQVVDDLLKQALALDPNFALAHLMRANNRYLLFISNYDVSAESVKLWRTELDTAQRLAPDDPRVLSGLAQYASEIDHASGAALALFNQVEGKGLADPGTLSQKAHVLIRMGRLDESVALGMRALELDSRDVAPAVDPVQSLWLAHKANEAWRLIITGPSKTTPLVDSARYYFTGQNDPRFSYTPSDGAVLPEQDFPIDSTFERSRSAGKLHEMKVFLDRATAVSLRVEAFQIIFATSGVGRRPIAELRGWTDLLLGDRTGLAAQSRPIRDFIAKTRETPWNGWFLRMLSADADLFAGDKAAAVATAKGAMAEVPCDIDAVLCLYSQYLGAQILAWGGDMDGAATILERISLGSPGIAPAIAVCDPLFSVPLANNVRYKALKVKLEAQMAKTRLE
jgi:TolB-like protein